MCVDVSVCEHMSEGIYLYVCERDSVRVVYTYMRACTEGTYSGVCPGV